MAKLLGINTVLLLSSLTKVVNSVKSTIHLNSLKYGLEARRSYTLPAGGEGGGWGGRGGEGVVAIRGAAGRTRHTTGLDCDHQVTSGWFRSCATAHRQLGQRTSTHSGEGACFPLQGRCRIGHDGVTRVRLVGGLVIVMCELIGLAVCMLHTFVSG